MIPKADMPKLLGRSLTSLETDNYDLYLKIATSRLEELLCIDVCGDEGERTYPSRYGYRTVYVDPFTDITAVYIDGEEVEVEDYIIKQNDNLNGSWYNVIEFDTKCTGKNITVDADWGFESIPVDLKLLLAKLFAQGSLDQTSDNSVKSKKIEDFTITFKDSATFDEFVLSNKQTIDKYNQCSPGVIRNGRVRPFYYY